VEQALEQILNLLLESERAGVVALDALAAEVGQSELRQLLLTSKDDEGATARQLEELIRAAGGTPSDKVGPFADKVAAAASLRDRLQLLIHGEEWVARKVEEALALAPQSGPIHDYLQKMANRHRFEVEWGRAELIRLMNNAG
jgi:nitronate monooxygenase